MIITPMVCPLSFLLRRAANKPTRKTTESRRLLSSRKTISMENDVYGYFEERQGVIRFHAKLA